MSTYVKREMSFICHLLNVNGFIHHFMSADKKSICFNQVEYHYQKSFSHNMIVSGCDRELNVHF